MTRMWVRRGVAVGVLALVGAGAWAVLNWDDIQTRLAVRRFKSATTDEERSKQAESLVMRENGPRELLSICRDPDPGLRAAAVAVLAKHLETLPAADARGSELSLALIESFVAGRESEREALATMLPTLVQRCGAIHGAKCRGAVTDALKLPSVEARVAAIRAAIHPNIGLRAEVVALLGAPEPGVRRAAMFAIGPATDSEAVIGDEDLFRWLHDPDGDVRNMCRSALASRGRTDAEITLAKRLVDPDANERLKLLLDLRYDDELPDTEPWLERLGRDRDPGVRAGAARVMSEINVERKRPAPAWVARIADGDPSPAVRRVARQFGQPPAVAPDPAIRLIQALDTP